MITYKLLLQTPAAAAYSYVTLKFLIYVTLNSICEC